MSHPIEFANFIYYVCRPKFKMKLIKKISVFLKVFLIICSVMTVSLTKANESGKQSYEAPIEKDAEKSSDTSKQSYIDNVCLEAVIPLLTLDLSQDIYIGFKKQVLKIFYVEKEIELPLYLSKYFKNLFLYIISANAP